MLGINLSLARRTMLRQLGYAVDYDGTTENLQITNPKNIYSGEYSLKADFANDVVGQVPAGLIQGTGQYLVKNNDPSPFGGSKYTECTSVGTAAFVCNQAFGKWEFDLLKSAEDNVASVYFMCSNTYPVDNYHRFAFGTLEQAIFNKCIANSVTNLMTSPFSYIQNNVWYRIRIERLTNGQFTISIKGGNFPNWTIISTTGGSNPVTDGSYTSSNYLVLNLGTGDRIANIQCEYGTGSFDLSGFERILHSGNRDFETPVNLSSEKLTNGNFNAWTGNLPDGFTVQGDNGTTNKITNSGNAVRYQCDGAWLALYSSDFMIKQGRVYKMTYDIVASNTSVGLKVGSLNTFNTDVGVGKIFYFLGSSSGDYTFHIARVASCDVTIDNVSVKELLSDWTDKGNHTCYVSGTDKKSGNYALAMVSTGAGDAVNNCIELPASKFRILQNGDKYAIDGPFARGTGILGNNLITNGNFANWTGILPNETPVGWSVSPPDANNYVSNASGACRFVSNGSYIAMSQNMLVIGKTYEASVNVTSVVSGTIVLTRGTSLSADEVLTINSTGLKTVRFVATGTALHIKRTTACDITLDDIVVKEVTLPTLNIVIGGKQKATTGISCIPGAFTKLVHNFECTEAEINQPIKVFCNQADTIYLDEFSFPQHFDMAINFWAKPSGYSSHGSIYNAFFGKGNDPSALSGYGYGVYYGSENKPIVMVRDNSNVIVSPTSPTAMNLNSWNLFSLIMSDVAASLYQNSTLLVTAGTSILGKLTSGGFFIGTDLTPSRIINGQMGEFQVVRFNNIGKSNYDASRYFRNQIPKKYDGGNALVCLHLKFSGPDDATFLKDYSPLQQLVTGINVTKADQVRGSYPYFSK